MNHPRRTHRSQSEWQKIVNKQMASGLSARRFCTDQNIAYVSFCNWRRRLSKDIEQVPLIDLSALMDKSGERNWHIELDLGDGIKLNLRQG